VIWLKSLHIAAISIWAASLICLPGLYLQRAHVSGEGALHRLQNLTRFLYVKAMSPAAFIGIASGTALIFLRATYSPWFEAKLWLVGLLVVIHTLNGLVVLRLFNEGESYPLWRFMAVISLTLLTLAAILLIVLAKPDLPPLLPAVLSEPGGLQRIFFFVIDRPEF